MAEYTEYLVEYNNETLMVYLSGLDADGFWNDIANHEANNVEEFAEGYAQRLRDEGKFVTITEETL